jgi:hypothetical protein
MTYIQRVFLLWIGKMKKINDHQERATEPHWLHMDVPAPCDPYFYVSMEFPICTRSMALALLYGLHCFLFRVQAEAWESSCDRLLIKCLG